MQAVLEGGTHHHLAHVLRLKPGAPVCLFDGGGQEYEGVLLEIGRHRAVVEIRTARPGAAPSPLQSVLALGISRSKHFDLALQKATELGVSRILPLATARSPGPEARAREKQHAHWRSVIIGACEQCERAELPALSPVTGIAELVADAEYAHYARLLMDPAGTALPAGGAKPAGVVICCGPEGGFTNAEADTLAGGGFQRVGCGPRILRTETAPLVMLSLAQYLWGDLGKPGDP